MPAKTISVRPPQRIERRIIRLARELDKSSGQLASDALEAIIEMVEAREPRVPKIVRVARALRQSGISFASEDTEPFAAENTVVLRVAEGDTPSEPQPPRAVSDSSSRSPRRAGKKAAKASSENGVR